MADHHSTPQVQRLEETSEIVCIRIHLVAIPCLFRPAMAAAIMGDDAITVLTQEKHLCIPCVGVQRPTVRKNYGLTGSPVLVEDLCSVFHRDCVHRSFSLIFSLRSGSDRRLGLAGENWYGKSRDGHHGGTADENVA